MIMKKGVLLGGNLATATWERMKDDEVDFSRKETGYIQSGALYDPIPGKQYQPHLREEKRDPSYWEAFNPTNH